VVNHTWVAQADQYEDGYRETFIPQTTLNYDGRWQVLSTPFLFYFGLRPESTALDLLIKYFGPKNAFSTLDVVDCPTPDMSPSPTPSSSIPPTPSVTPGLSPSPSPTPPPTPTPSSTVPITLATVNASNEDSDYAYNIAGIYVNGILLNMGFPLELGDNDNDTFTSGTYTVRVELDLIGSAGLESLSIIDSDSVGQANDPIVSTVNYFYNVVFNNSAPVNIYLTNGEAPV